MSLTNPFFSHSLLPYQAPRFDLIKTEHYRPAFDKGIKQKRADIAAIIANSAAPDFANTVLALEKSGELLTRVTSVFFAMTAAHTHDELQRLDEAFSAELAELANDIWLNRALFSRVDCVWQQRDALGLDDESVRLIEVTHQRFVLAGAQLSDADKAQLRALNTEAATLTSQFNQRLLAANKSGGLVVDYAHQLEGLSAEEIASARQAASEKGLAEGWLIPLLNTTQQPALSALRDRQTRENLFNAGWRRAEKGDDNDTRALIQRLVALRARQAQLLGFADYASWKIADQMAKTPEAALAFMRAIVPAARQRALSELTDIQQVIDDEQGGFTAQAWDWSFYAGQVRRAKYALDESQLKPYFELNTVLHEGVFWTANQLFGIKFIERFDIPVYHPDVRVWEIFDHNGVGLALFTAISLPGIRKAAVPGWAISSSSRRSTKPSRLFTTSVIIRSPPQDSPRCYSGMMSSRCSMSSAIPCTDCLRHSAMRRCREPIRRVISSSFHRKSMNTGRAIRRCLTAMPAMRSPAKKCQRRYRTKCVRPACSIRGMT